VTEVPGAAAAPRLAVADSGRPGWVVATVFAIVVMIVWTLVVKYLVPLVWFWSERFAGNEPAAVPVMWDFWPLAHVLLAVGLWRRAKGIWAYALAVAVVESGIVMVKLASYLGAPELTLWKLLWLTNKLYVLALFLCLLCVLAGPGRAPLSAAGEGWR
jgi:hypothetical protein